MNLLKHSIPFCLIFLSQTLFSQDLIPYRYGELWGYCTPSKKVVIPPQFEKAELFSDGLAAVGVDCDADCYDVFDGKWGYINTKGEFVISPQYAMARNFQNNRAFVSTDGMSWFEINKSNETLSAQESYPESVSPDVELNGFRKYYKTVIKLTTYEDIVLEGVNRERHAERADSIYSHYLELGLIRGYSLPGTQVNIISPKGKLLFPKFYDQIEIISEKLFKVYSFQEGKVDYISDKGLLYADPGKEAPLLFPLQSIEKNIEGELNILVSDNEFNRYNLSDYLSFTKARAVVLKKVNHSYEVISTHPFERNAPPNQEYDSLADISWFVYLTGRNDKFYNYYLQSLEGDEYKVMLCLFIELPDEQLQNELYFNLYQKGLRFTTTQGGQNLIDFYYNIYEFRKPWTQNQIMSDLLEDINMVGNSMIEQKDSQNMLLTGNDNPYAGRMLYDVMSIAMEEDVIEFLKYVNARPYIYMGQPYKISEVFATWLASGAPRVIESSKP